MDTMFGSRVDFSVFSPERLKANELTPRIMSHLACVYTALVLGLVAAGAGVAFHLYTWLGGVVTALVGMGLMAWMSATDPAEVSKRQAMFAGFCFLQGMSLGELVAVVLFVDPSILVTALLGTTTVFICFTMATMLAKRRSMLHLGGLLSSAMSWLLLASFANVFFGSSFLFNVQLYLGLAVFCAYVMFDTELIIAKAHAGSSDYLWHAVELFIDFVAIFVRIAVILLRQSESNDKRKGRR